MTNLERLAQRYANAMTEVQRLEKKMKSQERDHRKKEMEILRGAESALGASLLRAMENKKITIDFVWLVDFLLTDAESYENKKRAQHRPRYLGRAEVLAKYQEIKKDWEARILETARTK